ncbi:MAG TPA: VWA domain-containing protein [Pyrinomonadaceae bacterium]|jgi:VWFA-related protein
MKVHKSGASRLALAGIIVLLASPVLAGTIKDRSQEQKDAALLNAQGLELYNSGKYEDAVKAYKQAVKVKPDYAEAHNNLGDAYFQLKQYKKAVEAYRQAIRYKPDLASAHNHMGTAYFKQGEHNRAIEAYREAIRLDPKSPSAYHNLGAVYLERGDKDAALEQYKILKALDSEMADSLYLLIYKPSVTVFDANGSGVVRLNVAVTDQEGNSVTDLRQEDFLVQQDGISQTITVFSKDEPAVVYGIVIDNSGTFADELEQAIEASKIIINSNRAGDESFIVRFIDSEHVETVQDFTPDKAKLGDALDSLYIEGGQTALIDAVYLSAQRVAQYKPLAATYRRRAIILMTDGDESASYYSMDKLLNLLRRVDVQVFTVSLAKDSKKSDKLNQIPRPKVVELLTKLATETGGQAFFPKSVGELQGIANQITNRLRAGYLIGYKPVNNGSGVAYKSVTVSVVKDSKGDKRTATTRAGYVIDGK